jgi:hypothetical protein
VDGVGKFFQQACRQGVALGVKEFDGGDAVMVFHFNPTFIWFADHSCFFIVFSEPW